MAQTPPQTLEYGNIEDATVSIIISSCVTVAAGILASIYAPHGTLKWKTSFLFLLLIAMSIVELYYIGRVAIKVPPDTQAILRVCRSSRKGGKPENSLRDCASGESGFCSLTQPCTPCDYPLSSITLNDITYLTDCQVCNSISNPGICLANGKSRGSPTCYTKNTSEVEPCSRCCLDIGGFPLDYYIENNCERVFNESFIGDWATSSNIHCGDPSFPIKTLFGCCPNASIPSNLTPISIGTNNEQFPPCLLTGPNNAGWYFCKEELIEIRSQSTLEVAQVPRGCRIFSNGFPTGDSYCRQPTFIE